MKHTKEEIENHLAPAGDLREQVRAIWMRNNRAKFGTDEDAEKGFDDHWLKAQGFLSRMAESCDVVLLGEEKPGWIN